MNNLPVPIGGTTAVPAPTLTDVLTSADRYLAAEKSAATRLAYRSDFRDFTTWCDGHGLLACPARVDTVAGYLAGLADRGLKASTIGRRAAAIAFVHKRAGHEPPTNAEALRGVLSGIRRTLGTRPVQKAPATAEVMAELLAHVPKSGATGLRDRALLLIGFGGAFRRSELVAVDVADLEFRREGVLIHLGATKTDQEGQGGLKPIPNGTKLKPVAALRAWLELAAIVDGPVFRRIRRGGHVTAERLTDRSVADIVKRYAGPAGYDLDDFAGHSLRAGFVTQALEDGADLLKVMTITGHTEVRTLKKYDRRANAFRNHAGREFL